MNFFEFCCPFLQNRFVNDWNIQNSDFMHGTRFIECWMKFIIPSSDHGKYVLLCLCSRKRKINHEKNEFFFVSLEIEAEKIFEHGFWAILSDGKISVVYDGIIRFAVSYPYLEILRSKCQENFRQKWGFCFIVSWIVKIAQHLQIDKIYHRKEQKISYLVVYLVDLGKKSPGSTWNLQDYSWIGGTIGGIVSSHPN